MTKDGIVNVAHLEQWLSINERVVMFDYSMRFLKNLCCIVLLTLPTFIAAHVTFEFGTSGLMFEQVAEPEHLRAIVESKIQSRKSEFERLSKLYDQARIDKRIDEVKTVEAQINRLVDQENAFKAIDPKNLTLAEDIVKLDDFKHEHYYQAMYEEAVKRLLAGTYVPQFIFAGAATRLNRGEMYPLDIWDIAQEKNLITAHEPRYHYGMGQRQIRAYRQFLAELAQCHGLDQKDVIARQTLIFNVNQHVVDTVIQDLVANNFYGFNREQIYIIVQPMFHGYRLEHGEVMIAPESAELPYGHGYNAMQLRNKGEAFMLSANGTRMYLTQDVLSMLDDDMVIGTHRINDLTRLTKETVINLDALALGLYYQQHGYNVIADLVLNPLKQKGGNALRDRISGKQFLLETVNAKGNQQLDALLLQAGAAGAPYNAFRLLYHVKTLKELLAYDLPYNLRFKDGYFYLESVTGDIMQLPVAQTLFFTTGDCIHDFKEEKNLPDAITFLKQQDAELQIASVVKIS